MSAIRRLRRKIGFRTSAASATESDDGGGLPLVRVRRRGVSPNSAPLGENGDDEEAGYSEVQEFDEAFFLASVLSMDCQSEAVRSGSFYVHVSSLIDYCARREALAFLAQSQGVASKTKRVGPGDRIVWAIGRAVEHHVRKQFIAAKRFKGVYGKWTCKCGSSEHTGFRTPTFRRCRVCNGDLDNYGEVPLVDADAKVVGNPDLLYLRPDNELFRVVEIKSMNVGQFKALEAPLQQHVLQAFCYQRLLSLNGFGADDSVTIFYACKDFTMRPYKSYTVTLDSFMANRLDDMWGMAHDRAEWIRDNSASGHSGLPPRLDACSSINATRVKNCSECIGCFNA